MKQIALTPLKRSVTAEVGIPGSKSYTNRAMILAALSTRKVAIKNALVSEDTIAMMECLQTLGMHIEQHGTTLYVSGNLEQIKPKEYHLNARLSGTTIRFLLAFACIVPGVKILGGEKSLNARPIGDLVSALRLLGAKITYLKKEGFPPVKVSSSKLTESFTTLSGAVSSQFISALLMIAPVANIYEIKIKGRQVSKPYIDMTIASMKAFGVTVRNRHYTSYTLSRQQYNSSHYTVEGDYSTAAYFAAIAALTKSTITLKNLKNPTYQGDVEFIKILERMGNEVKLKADEVTVIGSGVRAVSVNMENCPDQIQTLAVLAAFAPGKTTIRGIKNTSHERNGPGKGS